MTCRARLRGSGDQPGYCPRKREHVHRPRGDRTPENDRPSGSGYSLIAVLLTLVGVSFLAAAGFLIAMGDFRVARNEVAAAHAFFAADSGLNTVLGTTIGYPADTTVISSPTDTTMVTATRLVEIAGGRRLYLLRSRARHYAPDGAVGDRTVTLVLLADPDSTLRPPEAKHGTWREEL